MLHEVVAGQLWTAEMPASKGGFEFGARMTVIRLPDGGLWVHSPIQLDRPMRAKLDALGEVRAIVAPSGQHYGHVAEFHAAYPEAKVCASPKAARKLRAKTRVDVEMEDEPHSIWADVIDQAAIHGSRLYDEVDFVHRPTRTLILTDLCFNIPPTRGWSTTLWARLLGVLGELSFSNSFNMAIQDREEVEASLNWILTWNFDRIILSHGDIVETGGRAAFIEATKKVMAQPEATV